MKTVPLVTISSLYRKDFPTAYIIPGRSFDYKKYSSLNEDVERNSSQHDMKPMTNPLNKRDCQRPVRACSVIGDELPVLLEQPPDEILQKHWKEWIPWFPKADIRDLITTNITEAKIISFYPFKGIPKNQHAVDPDVHLTLHNKATIPKTGSPCPKHMSRDNFTLPCMIKTTHGQSCLGTYKVHTKQQAQIVLQEVQNKFNCSDPVITEVIDDITGNFATQFFLFGNGDVYWIGVTHQIIASNFKWKGAYLNWDEQIDLKDMLYKTLEPAISYLHKKGYIGFVGIDVLKNSTGLYINDINPRICGTTQLLLIAPHMAELGLRHSEVRTTQKLSCDVSTLLAEINKLNHIEQGIIVILSASNTEYGCKACLVVYTTSRNKIEVILEKLEEII